MCRSEQLATEFCPHGGDIRRLVNSPPIGIAGRESYTHKDGVNVIALGHLYSGAVSS